jgi:hypothetical protein
MVFTPKPKKIKKNILRYYTAFGRLDVQEAGGVDPLFIIQVYFLT